jgi:deoxycytidylate deaminase
MRYLTGKLAQEAWAYIELAAIVAQDSTCHRSQCGSIIIKDGLILGRGYNSPPGGERLEACFKDTLAPHFKSDRTCCIHAEERAVMDALSHHADKIEGSRLYFIRLDEEGKPARAGQPYCTICSKMTLDARVGEFVLWHDKGICVYNTKEYNEISFRFGSGLEG